VSTITAAAPSVDPARSAFETSPTATRLGRYTDCDTGERREIARLPIADGSSLVVDRLAGTHGDPRLLARLAADEPGENAQVLCGMYLADESRGSCRPVTAADLEATATTETPHACAVRELRDDSGIIYRVRTVALNRRFPELHWTRSILPNAGERFERVRLREVIGRFEDYEPARSITANALDTHRSDSTLSTCCLASELARLAESPIVLNRRLREAVQARLALGDVTMSEIAIRCGRVKQDRRGNTSGETSWLGRRLGLLAEGGADQPTPWVHSDTLALIARDGLGLSPREVELA
jgi:hypothetical protein